MNKRAFFIITSLFIGLFALIGAQTSPAVAEAPATKQIAVSPADLARGDMQLPDPAGTGTRSHSAMIPVTFSPAKDGSLVWQSQVPFDASQEITLMTLAGEANWSVDVRLPDGQAAPLSPAQTTSFGLEGNTHAATVYTADRAQAGLWTVTITADARRSTDSDGVDGYLVASSDSAYRIYSHLNSYDLLTGRVIGLTTYAYNANTNGQSGAPTIQSGLIGSAAMTITAPDGQVSRLAMPANNDGTYSGNFVPSQAGNYTAQVTVRGTAPNGQAVLRTSQHTFPVHDSGLTLATTTAQAVALDSTRLGITLSASNAPERVFAFAEVWGMAADGAMAPVAGIGGITAAGTDGSLSLTLDARWVALANVRAPFELRNVRVQDVNTHIPLAKLSQVGLDVVSMPMAATSTVTEVSDEMLMGVRPEYTGNPEGAGVLMLIHGYCSSSVWPTNNFSDYALFLDLDQNRSHDEFAQLIDSYGDNFSSFGAVAHSQGGAASTHLYSYYWSGLDNSSGNRLIQSVGTPYQGTALAGNLALLGQIFGAGCGSNFDLTYNGAALWLSGVPSWARSEVYYHTTSETTKWWRWDYCQIATEPFLDDPEDGVTEKWSGKLAGANNMGHRKGQCHTSGMRDMAQTSDSNRNATMNANGNR